MTPLDDRDTVRILRRGSSSGSVPSVEVMLEGLKGDIKVLKARVDHLEARVTEKMGELDERITERLVPGPDNRLILATLISSSLAAISAIIVAVLQFS